MRHELVRLVDAHEMSEQRACHLIGADRPMLRRRASAVRTARWSVDFVHDQLVTGRRLRFLHVVDEISRECFTAVVDTSISGKRVARELFNGVARRGKPGLIFSDHGARFTSNAMREFHCAACPSLTGLIKAWGLASAYRTLDDAY